MLGPSTAASPLVGRDALVATAVRLVDGGARLLTITGRHGVGKTRVALAVAKRLPGRCRVVPLDDADDRAEYLARAAEALELDGRAEAAVVEHLRATGGVLVLDGCRATPVACEVVTTLLGQVEGLVLIVTAPSPLGLAQERVVLVPPLDLPPADETDPTALASSASVALFLQAADRAAPVGAPTADDLPTVAEVCRRLDGLPLALTLAAARLSLMQPSAMLAEMSRLGAWELVGLSVEDEVDRMVCLLDEPAHRVLLALATMSGGAGLDAVAAVAGLPEVVAVHALSLLVDLQLAAADPVRARVGLVASATSHVRERYADDPAWRQCVDRHTEFFRAQARAFARRPDGSTMQRSWLLDHGNRLAALAALRQRQDRDGALRMAVDCMAGFEHRGEPGAGSRLLAEVLSETEETASSARISAHLWLGRWEAERADGGRTADARDHVDSALRLARQGDDPALHLDVLAALAEDQGVLAGGVESCEAAVEEGLSLTLAPELEVERSAFLSWHAAHQHRRGRVDDAASTVAEALEIARRRGERRLVTRAASVYWQLPREARLQVGAVPSLPQLLDMAAEQGDLRAEGWVHVVVVGNALDDGDDRAAIAGALELLRLARRTQQPLLARQALAATLRLLARYPDPPLSASLGGVLAQHAETVQAQLPPRWADDLRRSLVGARHRLSEAAFDAAHRAGVAMPLWDAIDLAERRLAGLLEAVQPTSLDDVPPAQDGGRAAAVLVQPPVDRGAAASDLTPRERQVLTALTDGGSNKEVARALGLRPKTVAHHCASIYAKLGVRNRTEAVAEGLRSGLV